MKLCAILLLLSSTAFAAEIGVRHYYGSQVLRANATTKEQFQALSALHDEGNYDFWTHPAYLMGTDIMADADQLDSLKMFFSKHGITHTVMIDDVERIVEEQRTANRVGQTGRMNFNAYQRFSVISQWLDDLAIQYPELVETTVIGKSTEDRDLKLVKITTPGSTPNKIKIFIDGTFHSREWISGSSVLYIINELVTKSTQYQTLLDAFEFHILPITNPDGYEYSHTFVRLWRKTRSDHDSPMGCKGVDPNRNFGYEFGGPGTSTNKCADTYLGPDAFSEPETAAVSNYILENKDNLQSYITLHSYSQMWLVPWGWTSDYPVDFDELYELALSGADALTAVHGTQIQTGHSANMLYPTAGASDDWAKAVAGVKYSYTLELRDTGRYGFLLPPHQIIPTGEETWAGIQVVCRYLLRASSRN